MRGVRTKQKQRISRIMLTMRPAGNMPDIFREKLFKWAHHRDRLAMHRAWLGVVTGLQERAMPNDAKLGLLVGVGVVLLIALFFFRPVTPPISTPAAAMPRQTEMSK
jgi:hypothetical protein